MVEKSEGLQQFEERFEKVKGKRKSRKAKLLQEFTPMFKDGNEADTMRSAICSLTEFISESITIWAW